MLNLGNLVIRDSRSIEWLQRLNWLQIIERCEIENGVFIGRGSNVDILATSGPEECALQCAATEECVAWSLQISTKNCWLKSVDRNKGRGENWITGTKACGNNFLTRGRFHLKYLKSEIALSKIVSNDGILDN